MRLCRRQPLRTGSEPIPHGCARSGWRDRQVRDSVALCAPRMLHRVASASSLSPGISSHADLSLGISSRPPPLIPRDQVADQHLSLGNLSRLASAQLFCPPGFGRYSGFSRRMSGIWSRPYKESKLLLQNKNPAPTARPNPESTNQADMPIALRKVDGRSPLHLELKDGRAARTHHEAWP